MLADINGDGYPLDVSSGVANRANDPRRVPSDKGVCGDILGNSRTCRDDRVLAYRYATDDGCAGRDPHAFFYHDGLSDGGDASPRRFKGVACRDNADVRPDHHIVCDVEAAKVIESAILIDEDIMPDADFVPAGSIKWWNQQEAVVNLFTDKFAEQGPNFVRIVERQTINGGGDRHRSFDVCQHGR